MKRMILHGLSLVAICGLVACSSNSSDDVPVTQNTTRVDFDITVPAYVSSTLQVRLVWGEKDMTAAWVTDETWEVSDDFPVNTEHLLTVTFNDDNGGITLGSFETVYTTGDNATESFQITADQFDTNRWDSDSDGVSNLDELLAGTNPLGDDAVEPVQASLETVVDKTFRINWHPSAGATFYRVLENPDGVSGFSQIGVDLESSTRSFDHRVALYNRFNARYIVQACNQVGCADSDEVNVAGTLERAIGYFKASDPNSGAFGVAVALSSDGQIMVIGTGSSVTVFVRSDGNWQEQTVLTAPNGASGFGGALSLSSDGNTLAVGATGDDSAATGVNGDQTDNTAEASGAVYVFTRLNEVWQHEAYLKASNTDFNDNFGDAVSLSADGNTIAVGAYKEDSLATGINGDQDDNSADNSGAVYVFTRTNGSWQQQAYVKASNTDLGNQFGLGDEFGRSVSLNADGNTLAVGASRENSAATGINGNQDEDTAGASGAVYIYVRNNASWQQQAYLKASNTDVLDFFGRAVSLTADGNTLAVGAFGEDNGAMGINGDQSDQSASASGAVYMFVRNNGNWQQQVYLKSSNPDRNDLFGLNLSISADGNRLAVGAYGEDSTARGINGDQSENSVYQNTFSAGSGAVYVFARSEDNTWQQQAYVKASNTDPGDVTCARAITGGGTDQVSGDLFGDTVSLSADGKTLAVGAPRECSTALGINGDQEDNSRFAVGAVYLY